MTAESTRTLKEARALLYPFLAVVTMCLFPPLAHYFDPPSPYWSQPAGFSNLCFEAGILIGIPLLASMSFGNEFRHKTMEMLVSQPLHRMQVWREKWTITVAAALIAGLAAYFSWDTPLLADRPAGTVFVVFFIVTTCSATFWTLLARSTIGGLLLNLASFIPIFLAGSVLWEWSAASVAASHADIAFAILRVSAVLLGYSATMLWLGRWLLLKKQSAAGLAGPDLMTALPSVLPSRIASVFRCDPKHVVLNMIRKELRLLRPLWLLAAIYVAGWIPMVAAFSRFPAQSEWYPMMLTVLAVISATYAFIAVFLAASLSLGEEQSIGIQMWHMALPLSLRMQWLVKLLTASSAALICTIIVPAVLGALDHTFLPARFVTDLAVKSFSDFWGLLPIGFLVIFWCAVVVRDLTRTAGLLVATLAMFAAVNVGGKWIADRITDTFDWLTMWIITSHQMNPYHFNGMFDRFPDLSQVSEWVFIIGIAVTMTVHTCIRFRRLPEERAIKALRPLLPYLIVELICVLLIGIRSWNGYLAPYQLQLDVKTAFEKFQPDISKLDDLKPLAFRVEDLSKASTVPTRTQRWLRNADMTIAARNFPPGSFLPGLEPVTEYFINIHLSSGTKCRIVYIKDHLWFLQCP